MTEHTSHQQAHSDPRTNDELFHTALAETDEEAAWIAISELQHRGSRDVFKSASQFCVSLESHERRVGVDILGQLGTPNPTFHAETLTILLDMLAQEHEPTVLKSIAIALGHRNDPRAIEPLVRFKNHPDEGVREGVVFGMLGHEDELAIQTLIELSRDSDANVRDWATFGLGSQIKADTPAIREALVARLTDAEDIVRNEAIIGLDHRHD